MSDTPITDAATSPCGEYDGCFCTSASVSRQLERELAAANERHEELRRLVAEQNVEIEQICGKALGYPWYKDDQKNFPGSDETDGVCVGEHVAETIVAELADKYAKANDRIKRLEEALRPLVAMHLEHKELSESDRSNGYADAYYCFYKGQYAHWDNAVAALAEAKAAKS